MVGERHPELLVQLVAVVFVSFAEQGDDVAERFDEGAELGLGELAARCRPAELGVECLAFAFEFGDPVDDWASPRFVEASSMRRCRGRDTTEVRP